MNTKKSAQSFATEAKSVIFNLLSAGTRLARFIEVTSMTPEQKENLSKVVTSLTKHVEAIQLTLTQEEFNSETIVELMKNSKESLKKTEDFLAAMSA